MSGIMKIVVLVFAVLVLLIAGSVFFVTMLSDRQQERANAAAVEAERAQIQDELIRQLENPEGVTADDISSTTDRSIAMIERMSKDVSEKDKKIMGALTTLMQDVRNQTVAYTEATDRFVTDGGIAIETAETKEELEKRKVELAELQRMNQKIIDTFKTLEADFTKKLMDVGATRTEAAENAKILSQSANADMVVKIREKDTVMFDAANDLISLGIEKWGSWSLDEESESILFETDADAERFGSAMAKFETAANEQAELQMEMARQMRQQ